MSGDTRLNQAFQIVQALAELPGSSAINIVSRKFPRFGPDPVGTTYEETQQLFPADQIPENIDVLADAEEIAITLQGNLPELTSAATDLVTEFTSHFVDAHIPSQWDVRAVISRTGQSGPSYKLSVFS